MFGIGLPFESTLSHAFIRIWSKISDIIDIKEVEYFRNTCFRPFVSFNGYEGMRRKILQYEWYVSNHLNFIRTFNH